MFKKLCTRSYHISNTCDTLAVSGQKLPFIAFIVCEQVVWSVVWNSTEGRKREIKFNCKKAYDFKE